MFKLRHCTISQKIWAHIELNSIELNSITCLRKVSGGDRGMLWRYEAPSAVFLLVLMPEEAVIESAECWW